jgi:creatinine deaminase
MTYRSHEHYMQRAFEFAARGRAEGGCPIGAVFVDNDTGRVLGEGHNALGTGG